MDEKTIEENYAGFVFAYNIFRWYLDRDKTVEQI